MKCSRVRCQTVDVEPREWRRSIIDLSASLPLRLLVGGSGPAAGAPEVVAVVPRRRWRLVAVTLDLDRDRVIWLRWRHDDEARSLDSQLQWQWLLLLLGSLWRWRHDDGARSHGALVEERLLEQLLPELLALTLPLLLVALATVLVLLLQSLVLIREAALDDPGIRLRRGEVAGNVRQGVLGHVRYL